MEVVDPTASLNTKPFSPPVASVTKLPLPPPPPGTAPYVCESQNQLQHFAPQMKHLLEQYSTGKGSTHILLPEKKLVSGPGYGLSDEDDGKDLSYVKFARREPPHEYSYPNLVDTFSGREDHNRSIKTTTTTTTTTRGSFKKPVIGSDMIKSQSGSSDVAKDSIVIVGSGSSCESTSNFDSSLSWSGEGKVRGNQSAETSKLLLPTPEKKVKSSVSMYNSPTALQTCTNCRETFTNDNNRIGMCSLAPADCVRKGIETVSCLQCAKCLLYHCMSDTEGDYVHPCDCSNVDGHRTRRWIGLSLLSILVPCLCFYLPLMACYKCGTACHICGGRHHAS